MSRIYHSENYVGSRKENYFEGWYFRHTGTYPVSFIVGISKNDGDRHSFVQYIDSHKSAYFRFDENDFRFDDKDLTVNVGGNTFSLKGVDVNLKGAFDVTGRINYDTLALFEKTFISPSVMGPFAYLPLPCNHAVISMSHNSYGALTVSGETHCIRGLGYIEKDFGSKFPRNYFWLHAASEQISIMTAVAHPAVLNLRGHLCIIRYSGKQYNLSLYTGARIKELIVNDCGVRYLLQKGSSRLSLRAFTGVSAQTLTAPARGGAMSIPVKENLSAKFEGELFLNGECIDLSQLTECALEIVLPDGKI